MDINKPLKITIKTYGGKVSTFLPIAIVLSKHKGKLTAVVDRYAYSGGTILVLMCDEIIMTEYSNLGGINPYYLIPINSNHIKRASDAIDNSWMKVIFEYAIDTEKSVIVQLVSMLNNKKYTFDEINTIIQFFVYDVNHNVPLYYETLPEVIKRKITIIPYKKQKYDPTLEDVLEPVHDNTKDVISEKKSYQKGSLTVNKYKNGHMIESYTTDADFD